MKRCVFNRLSIGMIPRSYRESLTYEEQILWLQKYVNDMLEWLTELQKDFDNIDLNFEELEEKITEIRSDLTDLTNLVNTKASKQELNDSITTLENELRDLITSNYNILKEYVDTQDEYLQYQIDHFDIGNIKIYDPTTGLEEDIQTVIDNIYDQTRTEAITAGEFDLLLLSATEFDSKELTASEFDRYGKTLLEE
jgi:chromosome segregation ATPase